jgi:hypothetical protein
LTPGRSRDGQPAFRQGMSVESVDKVGEQFVQLAFVVAHRGRKLGPASFHQVADPLIEGPTAGGEVDPRATAVQRVDAPVDQIVGDEMIYKLGERSRRQECAVRDLGHAAAGVIRQQGEDSPFGHRIAGRVEDFLEAPSHQSFGPR